MVRLETKFIEQAKYHYENTGQGFTIDLGHESRELDTWEELKDLLLDHPIRLHSYVTFKTPDKVSILGKVHALGEATAFVWCLLPIAILKKKTIKEIKLTELELGWR